MGNYFQPAIETASREEILAIQNEKIVKQVKHVYENVKYYRDLMDEKGVKPEDIKGVEDIHKLPFLSKADLREAYPYGLLGTDLKNCVRIQSTSGTTGKRVVAFYTQHDIDLWEECTARAIVAAGGTEEDVVQVCYGYGLFTGGAGLHGGSHKVGCLTLPMRRHHSLLHTLLCCLHRRNARRKRLQALRQQAQSRHLRRRALDRGNAPQHRKEPRHQGV